MKRKFTKLFAALALLASVCIPLGMRGQTSVTWPNTTALPAEATAIDGDENVTIKVSSTNTYTNPLRIYANTTVTIAATNSCKILSVAYEASSTGNYVTNAQNATVAPFVTPTVNDKIVTWTYAESDNVTEFTFKPSAQTRSNGITVTYTAGGATPTVATPTFSPAGGTYTEAQEVTITCTTEGTRIFYTLDGSEPDDEGTQYTEPITVSETTTIKAIAYDSDDIESNVASATYTILSLQTIAEARTQGTGTVYTQGVVTSCVNTTGYIQDNEAAICVYGASLTVGDEIKVVGTLTNYNGLLEITNPTVTVLSSGNTVNSETMTIAEINASNNQGWFVHIENATVTGISGQNTTIAQGENTIVVRGISGVEYAENDILTLDGNIGCYNSAAQIANPQNVVVQANENPVINASDVTLAYDATSGEIAYTIDNPVTGATVAANTTAEWLTIGTVGETVPFTCTVNEGAERTATVSLTYTYGDNETVTKNVTVTQEANPNIVDNISDITAVGTYTVQGTIVAKSTRGFIVGDGTGYVYYYNTSYDQSAYAIGDMVKLAGSVVAYGGVFEFNSSTTVTAATSSNYVEEEPTVITGTQMDARVASTTPTQLSSYVQYEGTLTVSGSYYNITNIEGATTAKGSISYPTDTEFIGLNGKQVKVTGYYVGVSSSTYYNTMIGSIEEVVSTEPTINLSTYEINATYEETEGTLTVTYANITEINANVFFCDADGEAATYDWITASINTDNNVAYTISANESEEARTAYFKVYVGETYSNLVTVTQEAYVAPALDYATLPFEFDDNQTESAGTDGLTENGLGSYNDSPKLKFDNTGDWLLLHFNEVPGTLTFDIKGNSFIGGTFTVQTSEDGETYTDLATYTTLGATQSESFTLGENVRYIKWIYTTKSSGNVALGNIVLAKPSTEPAISLNTYAINATAEQTQGTLEATYANITEIVADIYFCDAEGEAATYDWITASINNDNNVEYTILANEGEARTAYFKVYVGETYSNLVTVTQAAYVAPATGDKYVKVTSTADLTSGQYLIIYEEGSVAFNGGLETLDATGNTIEVIMNNNKIEVTNATAAAEFTIDVTAGTIKSASGCYIGQTSDANGLLTSTETAYTNTISIDNGNSNIVSSGDAYLRYNSTSGQTRFRYYKSSSYTGQKAIQLYKKVEDTPVTETYTLNITGYTSDDTKDGYYLIASPVTESPSDVAGMTEGDFDLYYYDDAEELEWRNYEDTPFNLVPGKGYLYAKKATTETPSYQFTLTGTLYTGEGEIELAEGWNLVGNPFGVEAEISMDYYALNPTATELIATSADNNNVAALQGVFVNKTQGTTSVIFVEADNGTNNGESKVVMNVTRNRGNVIDRAIVRFGEGQQLLKFQLNPNNTKIYVTEGNQDYAIVRSANEGEMPVSFKAAENGTYSFSVEAENVEMNYLHLIDNMTGMDVDLLQTPSYTFEAKTSDYASRFRLVFNANENGASEGSASFAFFNGTNWTVSNMGEATLQVLDMTGCVLSSETISGNAEINLNQPVGVYMLRMVNGNNVKVQKIVVK